MGGPFTIFGASVLALCFGPLIHRWVWDKTRIAAGLDAFVVLAVLGLVIGEVAPLAFGKAGYVGLATFLLGLASPFVADRVLGLHRAHRWAHWIVAVGVLLHAFADGVALSSIESLGEQGLILGLALVVHRIPVGLGIWTLAPNARPNSNPQTALRRRRNAIMLLIGVAFVTGLGQLWGQPALDYVGVQAEVFSAFAAGMLLHVVVHAPSGEGEHTKKRGPRDVLGSLLACVGAAMLWQVAHQTDLGHGEHAHHLDLRWALVAVPMGMLGGVVPPGDPQNEVARRRWIELLTVPVLLVTVLGGFAMGLVVASAAWAFLHRSKLRKGFEWRSWVLDAKALRDLALSGWIAGWLPVLGAHGAFGSVGKPTGQIVVGISTLVLFLISPSMLLMGLPLLVSMGVAPLWLIVAFLADASVRAWCERPISASRRLLVIGIGGVFGLVLSRVTSSWMRALTPVDGVSFEISALLTLFLFLWLCGQWGIRQALAGGGLHDHEHGPRSQG